MKLTKTNKMAHLTQRGFKNGSPTGEYNGIQIDRRVYTDGITEYIRINGYFFKLYKITPNWKFNFYW